SRKRQGNSAMPTPQPDTTLRITRILDAPREKVFDAWVDPELRKRWWGSSPDDRCSVCEIDARAGGKYRVGMVSSKRESIAVGEFREFVRPEKLVFTWSWEKPADGVQNSVVTLLFKALSDSRTE